MKDLIDLAPKLEDLENCIGLAITAHGTERHDHVIHYLKVCRKHIQSVNTDLEEWMGVPEIDLTEAGQVRARGCNVTQRKPTLDDYDAA